MGPKLIELCGRKADAWLGYFTTKKYVEEFVREHLEIGARKAGRDVSEIQICAEAVCSVSVDRELAMSRARKQVGFYATHSAGAQGRGDAWSRRRRAANCARASFAKASPHSSEPTTVWSSLLSITGTPEEARQKLAEYEGYIDHLVLHTPYVPPIEADESEDAFAAILDTFGDLALESGASPDLIARA